MVLMRLSFLSILVFILVYTASSQVKAGYEFNTSYNSGTMSVITFDEKLEIFPRGYYQVVPIRDMKSPISRLTLRFFSVGTVSGCARMGGFTMQASADEGAIKVISGDSELEHKREKRRYTNYDCSTQLNKSYFDVPIVISELSANKINNIDIKSGKYGKFLDLNVSQGRQKIVFSSTYEPGPGLPSVTNSFTYWIYPFNTYILSAPSAKTGVNVIQNIIDYGSAKGLTPLSDLIPEFRLFNGATNFYFFVDTKGALSGKVKSHKDDVVIGQMQVSRTIYGAKGPVEEPMLLDVHATIPGPYQ